MTIAESIDPDSEVTIRIQDEEKPVVIDALEFESECICEEAPTDAFILWSHAEALDGNHPLFQPVADEWTLLGREVGPVFRTLEKKAEDLDAHATPSYSGYQERRNKVSLVDTVLRRLKTAVDETDG